jgi:hypothetical protein
MESITLHFTPTPQDHGRGTRAFFAFNRRFWWWEAALIAIFLAQSLLRLAAVVTGRVPEVTQLPGVLFGFVVPALFVFGFVVSPSLVARRVARDERLRADTLYRLDDDGLAMSNRYAASKMDWPTFAEVIETSNLYLLLYALNKNVFQVIPKRAFESPEHETEFRQCLQCHIGTYQDRRRGLPWGLIWGLILGLIGPAVPVALYFWAWAGRP